MNCEATVDITGQFILLIKACVYSMSHCCCVWEREREQEREGGRWEVLMWVIVPSLALCNMIRARHREAGLCGPASCYYTAPHGKWIERNRGMIRREGGPSIWTRTASAAPDKAKAHTEMRVTESNAGAYCGLRQTTRCFRRWCPMCLLKDFLGLLVISRDHPMLQGSVLVSRGKHPAGTAMATPSPAAQSLSASALWGETRPWGVGLWGNMQR